jgi:hypothetical protein
MEGKVKLHLNDSSELLSGYALVFLLLLLINLLTFPSSAVLDV